MLLKVENIQKVDSVKKSNKSLLKQEDNLIFDFGKVPADSLGKQLWSQEVKSVVYDLTQELKIGDYSFQVLKDDNTAIARSQMHLLDLLKYYEGDSYHFYEGITTPYPDKFENWTSGFGNLSKGCTTQEKSYIKLTETLKKYSGELKRAIDRKLPNGTYDSLPNSIKEALIDLNYNKGLNKVINNKNIMDGLRTKDYSKVIANLAYVYSGSSNAKKVEEPGLYRRSLSRAILAIRDLKGAERQQGIAEIKNMYQKAVACCKNNNVSTIDIDKIYEQFTTGKITAEPLSAQSNKILVDDSFKGKGFLAVAKKAYESLGDKNIDWGTFYTEFKRINRFSDKNNSIQLGTIMNVPTVFDGQNKTNNVENLLSTQDAIKVEQKTTNKSQNTKTDKSKMKKNTQKSEKGFWRTLCDKAVSVLSAIGNFFANLFGFGDDKEKKMVDEALEHDHGTPFQKMIKQDNVSFEKTGDLLVATYNYKVNEGDNLSSLSKKFGSTVDRICNDNNIKDKDNISSGQNIKVQKLAYKVKKGDNLYRISQNLGLTPEILKDLNNIPDVNKIDVDQIIEIPGFIYEVKPKDTLYQISKQVGVTVDYLKKVNNLTSDTINPGQKIIVTYNDSDYAVDNKKKKIIVDKVTHDKTEIVDMSSNKLLANRPLLQTKRKVNGKVAATREVTISHKKGKLSGKTIILNAGHGYSQAGVDPGALAVGNIDDEWLINYDNAMRLKERLVNEGANVIFLQGHVNLIAKELAKKENKADMFISFHVNSLASKTQDRTQFYASTNKLKVTKKSEKLTKILEKRFDKWIKTNETINKQDAFFCNNKQDYAQHKKANYSVLRNAEKHQNIPSVLWETAFMVSPKGRERMKSPKIMNSYSDLMLESVVEYFNG